MTIRFRYSEVMAHLQYAFVLTGDVHTWGVRSCEVVDLLHLSFKNPVIVYRHQEFDDLPDLGMSLVVLVLDEDLAFATDKVLPDNT